MSCRPPPPPFSHIEREWQIPEWRHWYEHLMRHFTVVRYDGRGSGLSDRDTTDTSLEGMLSDLETVANAASLDRFSMFGCYFAGLPAMAYAALNPDRVSHLALWCAFARREDLSNNSTTDALRPLMMADWTLFTETMAHTVFGWEEGAAAHRLAEYMRESIEPVVAVDSWTKHEQIELTDTLPLIQAPTLVMHRRQFPLVKLEVARRLSAGIPNARLGVFDGQSVSPYIGDVEGPLAAMFEFFEVTPQTPAFTSHAHARSTTGFRTIMFTDMEGSTAATQRLGDSQAQTMIRTHNRIVRDALHAFNGSEVKHTGDGIMASFTSASSALECSIAIQRALQNYSDERDAMPISVRIGLNAGEPVAEGGDLFGTAVQLASRICAQAEPRQILVPDVVRQLVAGKGFLFADQGESDLRGFEDPVRIFEVRWNERDV